MSSNDIVAPTTPSNLASKLKDFIRKGKQDPVRRIDAMVVDYAREAAREKRRQQQGSGIVTLR